MNDNPWNVDNIARMDRERVQEEMRQIRMEQAAERARPRTPGMPHFIRAIAQWWAHAHERRPAPAAQRRPAQ